ncbi:hypothetical protein SMACR_05647 [Sordaria macrospora]|uniref:WGS project CABT00000000 data, contig 2.30 n=2 Tax=Sordaria macrospora TaxID=5147 RepID=F7W599_SORMK|nr:uncharacterized protein SMAC_05647 [Sordaria macrospora k-hell]KAA8623959.1 hypothetical protein SMACR_05647 [Sordaria macrospora]KAH7625554.1 hypothetical protein B0T09DRAFT_65407 [Sordaria sp. MPI-SDFR-AT-0083]WPJ62481.1 hypothetical protein SMAC4_05647 [Sordaria macrospora]CCC12687.1 unnamed protein product [Sordaria macrospora k-hell]
MTVSSTQTAIVSATATDASTVTETVTDTPDSVTTIQTVTATSTTTVTTTSTPTTVVPLTCQATGHNFQVTTPRPDSTYALWLWRSGNLVQWVNYVGLATPTVLSTVWSLENNGYIQPTGYDGILYILADSLGATVQIKLGDRASVDAGVAAGTMAPIKGCVDPATGRFTISANGRQNLVRCGGSVYISSGNGSDAGAACVQVAPKAVQAYM